MISRILAFFKINEEVQALRAELQNLNSMILKDRVRIGVLERNLFLQKISFREFYDEHTLFYEGEPLADFIYLDKDKRKIQVKRVEKTIRMRTDGIFASNVYIQLIRNAWLLEIHASPHQAPEGKRMWDWIEKSVNTIYAHELQIVTYQDSENNTRRLLKKK